MKPILAFSLLLAIAVPARSADTFVIITHPGVAITTLSKSSWSAIFLKKDRTWPDGTPIVALDQEETSAVRILFTTSVHRRRVSAVRSYWHQQIFAGREIPWPEKSSDAAVVAFVKATPGAVGYVTSNAATRGVTRIEIP